MHSIGEVGERLRRHTVEVMPQGGRGSGSGVLWPGTAGLVITNAHVSRTSTAMVRFWDGSESRAELRKLDARADLAALTVSVLPGTAAPIRDSSKVRRGELVVAVGNPLGFTGALSTGVVHAIGPVPGLGSRPYIQAQVRLAPGNSGGPLSDGEGRVIGINSMIVAGGLGLAIPSNAVSSFLARSTDPVRLGVTLRPMQRRGMLVLEIEAGSRAEAASLLPGDILVSGNGVTFEAPGDVADLLDSNPTVLRLEFLRGGSTSIRRVLIPLDRRRAEAA